MADMTILIPPDRVPAVRRALLHAYAGIADALHHEAAAMATGASEEDRTYGHRVELADAADALEQLGWTSVPASERIELCAHPELLSDVLCETVQAELQVFDHVLAAVSEGAAEPAAARAAFEAVLVSFQLFEQAHGQ